MSELKAEEVGSSIGKYLDSRGKFHGNCWLKMYYLGHSIYHQMTKIDTKE